MMLTFLIPNNLLKIFIVTSVIFLIISCNSNSKVESKAPKVTQEEIEALEKKGFDAYQEGPQKAIPIFKNVADNYESIGNYKKAGITNLNIAGIYEEQVNKIDSALYFSKKSLQNFEELGDTMQIANLYKYVGLLKGKNGNFEEAKSNIGKAIELYTSQKFEQGIAVSEFNLASTFYAEQDYENSIKYFDKSKKYWLSQNGNGRVYSNNILGIKIYDSLKNTNQVNKLIEENRKIEIATKVNPFNKKQFEEVITELIK